MSGLMNIRSAPCYAEAELCIPNISYSCSHGELNKGMNRCLQLYCYFLTSPCDCVYGCVCVCVSGFLEQYTTP